MKHKHPEIETALRTLATSFSNGNIELHDLVTSLRAIARVGARIESNISHLSAQSEIKAGRARGGRRGMACFEGDFARGRPRRASRKTTVEKGRFR